MYDRKGFWRAHHNHGPHCGDIMAPRECRGRMEPDSVKMGEVFCWSLVSVKCGRMGHPRCRGKSYQPAELNFTFQIT